MILFDHLWATFLEFVLYCICTVSDDDVCLFTDAAGSVCFSSIWKTHWCAALWHPFWYIKVFLKNLVPLELFPILLALEIWGDFLGTN